jgi:hypothetical protein
MRVAVRLSLELGWLHDAWAAFNMRSGLAGNQWGCALDFPP